MTDERLPSDEEIIRAVKQVLMELAPEADPQDVEEFLGTLRNNDSDELALNLGAGFGQFIDGKEKCDEAFDRYAQLIGATAVLSNGDNQDAES